MRSRGRPVGSVRRPRPRPANVLIGGERIFSVSLGQAVPEVPEVVCVHGLGVGGRYFVPLLRALAPYTRISALDLPGFGRSSRQRTVYNVAQLAAYLDTWLDRQRFERPPLLIGNSMGCQIVASLLAGRPDRASGMLLIGPTMDAHSRSAGSQIVRLVRAVPFERLPLLPLVAREYVRCGPRRLLRSLDHALADPLEKHLPQIKVPALVARGARDPIAPAEWVARVARLLDCGDAVTIEGTGHAVNFSAPDKLLPLALVLLRRA